MYLCFAYLNGIKGKFLFFNSLLFLFDIYAELIKKQYYYAFYIFQIHYVLNE